MVIVCRCIALAAALIVASAIDAYAEKRIALVIGNAAYQNTPALSNPVNDGEDLAAALKRVGFTVIFERNLNKRGMEAAITRFARQAQNADAAMFFYAGHGMQWRGANYLVPTDAKLEDEFNLNFELTKLDDVLFGLERASGVKILVLDACRNNPLLDRLNRTSSTRDLMAARGLAKIDSTRGMVIAYSTQVNQVAVDGIGRNSPFTQALVKEIDEPGVEIGTMFRRVAAHVNKLTEGRQLPELSVSLLGEFYLNDRETDFKVWPKFQDSRDPDALKDFLRRFPNSPLAAEVRERLNTIERAQIARLERERSERERLAKEQAARDKAQREQVEREKLEKEHLAREKAEQKKVASEAAEKFKIAGLPPATDDTSTKQTKPILSGSALVQEIKKELKRVGCYSGSIDQNWATVPTMTAVEKFVKFAKLPTTRAEPENDLLNALRDKTNRVCPLECASREVEKDGRCLAKSCPNGQALDDKGSCKNVKDQTASRPSDVGPNAKSAAGGSCGKMKDPLGCNCALKVGGYIYSSPGSYSGYRWQHHNRNAFTQCLYEAGRR